MSFSERYSRILLAHVQSPAEIHLAAAAELGRELVLKGIPPEEIAEIQQDALDAVLASWPQLPLAQALQPMTAIQSEMMMAYGLVFREQLAERDHSERQMRRSLQEKEMLLAEIHHRVKNNLQIISSLFNLQIRFTPDAATQQILRDSQSRIRSMALIHEQLYASQDHAHIPFDDYLRKLTQHLQQMYGEGRIRLSLELVPLEVDMGTAIPLGILITELVSNAFKHAFAPTASGVIHLRLRDQDPQAVLEVEDDGIGIAELPRDHRRSLGWHLIQTLIGQLRGEVEIASSRLKGRHAKASAGTAIRLRFPHRNPVEKG